MKNVGKQFEADFQKSMPDYVLLYRLPDSAQSFGGNSNLRFSIKNPFDFILWDSNRLRLFALEMKTVKGKAISFERAKKDSKEIHFHQIEGLKKWAQYRGIVCGFVIQFRELDKTLFIPIIEFMRLISIIDKSSFNYNDLVNNSIRFIEISQQLARTHWTYDIEKFLSGFDDEGKQTQEVQE